MSRARVNWSCACLRMLNQDSPLFAFYPAESVAKWSRCCLHVCSKHTYFNVFVSRYRMRMCWPLTTFCCFNTELLPHFMHVLNNLLANQWSLEISVKTMHICFLVLYDLCKMCVSSLSPAALWCNTRSPPPSTPPSILMPQNASVVCDMKDC